VAWATGRVPSEGPALAGAPEGAAEGKVEPAWSPMAAGARGGGTIEATADAAEM